MERAGNSSKYRAPVVCETARGGRPLGADARPASTGVARPTPPSGGPLRQAAGDETRNDETGTAPSPLSVLALVADAYGLPSPTNSRLMRSGDTGLE